MWEDYGISELAPVLVPYTHGIFIFLNSFIYHNNIIIISAKTLVFGYLWGGARDMGICGFGYGNGVRGMVM